MDEWKPLDELVKFEKNIMDCLKLSIKPVKKGIYKLNPMQVGFIEKGLLDKDKVLAVAPTSSGKTFLAHLKIAREIKNDQGGFIYVVPFNQLKAEKRDEFKNWEKIDVKTGDLNQYQNEEVDIAVCTYHTFDNFLRTKENFRIPHILILDEIDVLGDDFFGPILEATLARLKRNEEIKKILAISATVANMENLANWLNCEIYVKPSFRPVKLYKDVIRDRRGISPRLILDLLKRDARTKDNPILVVRFNKRWVRALAKNVAEELPIIQNDVTSFFKNIEMDSLLYDLEMCLKRGVGFHHADLPDKIKKKVVNALNNNEISVLVSTSTLARGVNLSIRTVIIEHITGYRNIKQSLYEQISGRAGRFQRQNEGYSFLVAKTKSMEEILREKYIEGELESLQSAFIQNDVIKPDPFAIQVLIELSIKPQTISDLLTLFKNYYFAQDIANIDEYLLNALENAIDLLNTINLIQIGMRKIISLNDYGNFYMDYIHANITLPEFFHIMNTFEKIQQNKEDYLLEEDNKYLFPKMIRQFVSLLSENMQVTYEKPRNSTLKKEAKKHVEEFILRLCGEVVDGKDKSERTFACFMEYIQGRSIKSITEHYNAYTPSIRSRVSVKISTFFNILKGLIDKFHKLGDINTKRKWISILDLFSYGCRRGTPFECVPLLQGTKGRGNIGRESSLKFVKSAARGNPQNIDYNLLNTIKDLEYLEGVGPTRKDIINKNKEDILKIETRIKKLLKSLGIPYNFQRLKNVP
ncbi:MAG: DEAD/DEAH box helicase [Candidatus Helarchaeota archaeon]